jgi:hypothetical protein
VVHGLSALLFPQAMVKGGVPGATRTQSPVGTRIPTGSAVVARRLGRQGLRIDTSRSVNRPGGLAVPGIPASPYRRP